MKKKIGPLPYWAWIVLAGGTIGIILYLRKGKGTSEEGLIDPSTGKPWAQEYAEAQLAATTGAAGSVGGGGTATPAETSASQAAANAAALKSQEQADKTTIHLAEIQANGLTEPHPLSFAQEIADVSGAVGSLQALGSLFQPAAPPKPAAKTPAKKAAAKATKPKPKPVAVRRTVQHATVPPKRAAPSHATPKPTHVQGKKQVHRTAPKSTKRR